MLREHLSIGDPVVVYGTGAEGQIRIGDGVRINKDCILETAEGGSIAIGDGPRIQPRCQFSAYKGDIVVERDVQIGPACAFYPHNDEFRSGALIKHQGFKSRGPIVSKDDLWIRYGVIVLDGVVVGEGAVVGAGAVGNRRVSQPWRA